MRIIKPSTVFYGEVPTDYDAAIKFIEMAGRTCYKSEDKITEDSAEKFVRKLIKAGHLAMVEHSNFVVKTEIPDGPYYIEDNLAGSLGKYFNFSMDYEKDTAYVGGSLTAWYQNLKTTGGMDYHIPFENIYKSLFDTPEDLGSGSWQVCPHDEIPKELHRYAVKFICDRGVSHELVRHRPCSFAQESTRYVNYGGKDMEFIEPAGFENWSNYARHDFVTLCESSEDSYNRMLNLGKLIPQQARAVLPNALKTEIITTADLAEWKHIFSLRCAPSAHPDFVRLAVPLRDKFKVRNLL